jgi:dTMP kinase
MNFWESGMDLRLGSDLYDSFKKYQSLLIEQFDKMAEEFHFEVIDARKSPDEIQDALRSKIQPLLTTSLRSPELPSDRHIHPA